MNEKAKKYIISMIDAQASGMPCLTFKYEYDASTATHIVDVVGKDDDCLASDDWQDFVYNTIVKFEKKFEDESLLFVSSDSLVRVNDDNLLYEVVAKTTSHKNQAFGSWQIKQREQSFDYNPNADTPEEKVRILPGFSFDFSLPKKPALTNVKAGFSYCR